MCKNSIGTGIEEKDTLQQSRQQDKEFQRVESEKGKADR